MNYGTSKSEVLSILKPKQSEKNTAHSRRMKHVRAGFASQKGLGRFSQAKFAGFLGVNTSMISHIEAGNTNIGIDLAQLIEQKTGFRQAWLLTGEEPEKVPGAGVDVSHGGGAVAGFTYVKKVRLLLSAGHGNLVEEEEAEDIYAFRTDWLKRKGQIANMRLAQVSGDSMIPTLKDGDFVLFDTSVQFPRDGKIMVLGIDNLLYVKRVRRIEESLIVVSDNGAVYEPWRIKLEDVKFLGLVIWHCGEI